MTAETIQAIKGDVQVPRKEWEELIRKSERYDIQYDTLKRTLTQQIRAQMENNYRADMDSDRRHIDTLVKQNRDLSVEAAEAKKRLEAAKSIEASSFILNVLLLILLGILFIG